MNRRSGFVDEATLPVRDDEHKSLWAFTSTVQVAPDSGDLIDLKVVLPIIRPMPVATIREAFDDPDWLFEPKWDGFRALAYIEDGECQLVSRKGHSYRAWPQLAVLA